MQTMAINESGAEQLVSYSREAMMRATRLISPIGTTVSPMRQLLSAPARWTTFIDGAGETAPTPRLRSIRRRGVTPPYPRPGRFDGMTEGTIILYPNGLVLEPQDRRHPCTNIAESSVQAAAFYRDAFEVWLGGPERLLIRTEPVEHIDSVFQAYFWNPVP